MKQTNILTTTLTYLQIRSEHNQSMRVVTPQVSAVHQVSLGYRGWQHYVSLCQEIKKKGRKNETDKHTKILLLLTFKKGPHIFSPRVTPQVSAVPQVLLGYRGWQHYVSLHQVRKKEGRKKQMNSISLINLQIGSAYNQSMRAVTLPGRVVHQVSWGYRGWQHYVSLRQDSKEQTNKLQLTFKEGPNIFSPRGR